MGANLLCFSVSRVKFSLEGRPKSIAKLYGESWPDFPLLSATARDCGQLVGLCCQSAVVHDARWVGGSNESSTGGSGVCWSSKLPGHSVTKHTLNGQTEETKVWWVERETDNNEEGRASMQMWTD